MKSFPTGTESTEGTEGTETSFSKEKVFDTKDLFGWVHDDLKKII